ncbi:ShlB/FhaC/HecB family hemolysin secretion/activation protein [Aestuariibacter sp. AA17]|uniref:ShlB/FhaC/HecB family hemolysin secretion/activation protein n=1 Tax=Fluctibacter corallii TaxID=2984329 RepID=A0ABT3A7P5_9ALTE|nr:ShlB/FhaC/HecB family hemolysin secretion/activation protein [Aestuariibacter sp. AA17]MCV2884697.1 ShlB/FhaC/HecB family hemolysin secretion/activation protein [Aestuariibacter sp. AA17]
MDVVCAQIKWFCALTFLVMFSASAQWVQAQEQVNQGHEKIIKEGLERLKHQVDPLLQKQDVFLQEQFSSANPLPTIDANQRCFDISTIDVRGATLLNAEDVERILDAHINQCLGLSRINQIVATISNLYLDAGFVTSRAFIKPQDLSQGTLSILVMEGHVESIVSEDKRLSEEQIALAFPSTPSGWLNLRDLEQGLENLNRLGSNRTTMKLLPGDQQGGTLVSIANQAGRAWRASLGLNNTGVETTGELQLDGNFTYDNLLGMNDSMVIAASTNVGEHELPHAESRSLSVNASMPNGYWLFSVNNNYFEYEQTVLGASVDFLTHGSSLNTHLAADHTLFRSQTEKVNVALSFTRKESKNFIEDVFLDTSSRVLYLWDFTGSYLNNSELGAFTASLSVNKSVPWFDAKRELADAEDDFQFTKYALDLGFSSTFDVSGHPLQYATRLHYLYSPDVILASEGISVGGRYSVRGVSGASLFGYRGGYIRNDVTLPIGLDWFGSSRLNITAGLDIGTSNLPDYADKNSDWVAGSALTFNFVTHTFNASLTYAKALHVPDFLNAQRQEIDLSVRINF